MWWKFPIGILPYFLLFCSKTHFELRSELMCILYEITNWITTLLYNILATYYVYVTKTSGLFTQRLLVVTMIFSFQKQKLIKHISEKIIYLSDSINLWPLTSTFQLGVISMNFSHIFWGFAEHITIINIKYTEKSGYFYVIIMLYSESRTDIRKMYFWNHYRYKKQNHFYFFPQQDSFF